MALDRIGRRSTLLAVLLLACVAATPAHADEIAGEGWRADVPAGWQPLDRPSALGILARSDAAGVFGKRTSDLRAFVDGEELAPRALVVLARTTLPDGLPAPTAGPAAWNAALAERAVRNATQHVLGSGHAALVLDADLPADQTGQALRARTVVASIEGRDALVALWIAPRDASPHAFETLLAGLALDAGGTRLERFLVWGSLAVLGLLLAGLVLYRLGSAGPTGRTVSFGAAAPEVDSTSGIRAVDGLPTFGPGGAPASRAAPAAGRPAMAGSSPAGLKSTL